MYENPKRIDVSESSELRALVEELVRDSEAAVLRCDGEDVALIAPLASILSLSLKRKRTREDYEAFLAAAGSWADMDTEKLIADIYESRGRPAGPPPGP